MKTKPSVIFFGSFQHYSTKVAVALHQAKHINLVAIVTTPPAEVTTRGKKMIKKTHTHLWADKDDVKVITPSTLNKKSLRSTIYDLKSMSVDFFIVAGYSKILPNSWLNAPKIAPLNLHFSLLPRWRGANPAEWAILAGDDQSGVSLIQMDQDIDTGPVLTQEPTEIKPEDTRETLYENLYDLAAKMAIESFENLEISKLVNSAKRQSLQSPTPYARKLERKDGFIPWKTIQKAISGQKIDSKDLSPLLKSINLINPRSTIYDLLDRASRSLYGFPGLWTLVPTTKGEKRLKIISSQVKNKKLILKKVQLEGQQATSFNHINSSLI